MDLVGLGNIVNFVFKKCQDNLCCLTSVCNKFKAGLRRRDAIQMEYEMTHDELNKKKEEREQVCLIIILF